MNPSRGVGFAAAESAGTMASKNGRASVAPAPRRKVLRDNAFFVTNILLSLFAPKVAIESVLPHPSNYPALLLIWNGTLFTTPNTNDEKVYLPGAPDRTISRTAGAS